MTASTSCATAAEQVVRAAVARSAAVARAPARASNRKVKSCVRLLAHVADAPDAACAVVGNEEAAVVADGDANGPAPDLAVGGDADRVRRLLSRARSPRAGAVRELPRRA